MSCQNSQNVSLSEILAKPIKGGNRGLHHRGRISLSCQVLPGCWSTPNLQKNSNPCKQKQKP